MQKIKNALHLNKDANHNGIPDSQERDRNHNGIPDSQERGAHHNPLDRNHDGRVNAADLKPSASRDAALDRNHNGIPDSLERNTIVTPGSLSTTTTTTATLSNDRNMNGIPDNLERTNFSNDRNHNGIPDNLEGSTTYLREAPAKIEVIEKEVVIHEHIHPVEKEEIQPVIYREREQLDVKQITQQLHETQIQPTLVQQRELAAEVRAPIVERAAPIQENIVLPSVDRDATMRSQVVHAPIVNEIIKKTVIEEIQPVLERDIIQSTLIQETKPIYEKIIEAPHVYRETITVVQDRGVVSGGSLQQLSAQGFNLGGFSNDRNMNGIPDNLERGNLSNDRNMNGIPDNLERGNLSNDRNMNGIPDNLERGNLSNDRNRNGIPDNLERGNLSNDRNMNGIPDNLERGHHHNPLDRNHDGKVDLKDLSGKPAPLAGQAPLRTI